MLVVLASCGLCSAFQIGKPPLPSTTAAKKVSQEKTFYPFQTPLSVQKKKQEPVEKEKQVDALTLLKTYMTPWRNPNSIFVYLGAALYVLGKYSEIRHIEKFGPYQ